MKDAKAKDAAITEISQKMKASHHCFGSKTAGELMEMSGPLLD